MTYYRQKNCDSEHLAVDTVSNFFNLIKEPNQHDTLYIGVKLVLLTKSKLFYSLSSFLQMCQFTSMWYSQTSYRAEGHELQRKPLLSHLKYTCTQTITVSICHNIAKVLSMEVEEIGIIEYAISSNCEP